ncbi:MAG: phosphatase PAP2 family protein [Actinomycetota bacterium]|nr:phosphatase PAP2 family protein [Actinomycetota bacterium]
MKIQIDKYFEPFDKQFDKYFEPLRKNTRANHIFYGASTLADHSIIWFMFAAIRGLRRGGTQYASRASIALLAESFIINIGVKSLFMRTRPSWDGDRPLAIRQPLTSSFPSGHSSAAATAFILLSDNDKFWPIYLLIALIVAPSRVHVRMHHASDVVAGTVIGTLFGLMVKRIFPITRQR